MLIIPVFTKSDTRKIAYICLALIALNSLIFFFLQSGDSRIQFEAYEYYQESGLLDLELTAYQQYRSPGPDAAAALRAMDEQERTRLTHEMLADQEFSALLEDNQIITPNAPAFKEWRDKRTIFEEKLGQSVTHAYGYSPRKKNLGGLFTYMFLHGGLMHLVGNMVFLYLIGAILEVAIGPFCFVVLYLVGGICASVLFGLVYPASSAPLIGASGAISALMGAYGIIFGLRRIRVFYSFGFYFNYARVPALCLFPVWLANEFLQLYLNEGSNVAYVAHIGGLLSGILIGSLYKVLLRDRIDALFEQAETRQSVEGLLDAGLKKVMNLDLQNAREDFQGVLALAPDNLQAIRQLYAIDKSMPGSEEFHQSAIRLLDRIKNGSADEYLEVFEDYKAIAKAPRLSEAVLERLGFLYLSRKRYMKAAPLISTLMKRNPQNGKLPGFLLKLAEGFRKRSQEKESRKCYLALARMYPTTPEGAAAAERLRLSSPEQGTP